MSTLKLDTLSNKAGTASVPSDTIVSGTAKAWVNFNGTGTVAIRRAFNVSSITDNGTGNYYVNFTEAMPDANYAAVGTHNSVSGDVSCTFIGHASYGGLNTASAATVNTTISGSLTDPSYVFVAVFR